MHYHVLWRMLWRHFSVQEPWVLEWIRIPSDACGLEYLSVDGEIFETRKKKLGIQKYPDTCGRGLSHDRNWRFCFPHDLSVILHLLFVFLWAIPQGFCFGHECNWHFHCPHDNLLFSICCLYFLSVPKRFPLWSWALLAFSFSWWPFFILHMLFVFLWAVL